MSAAFDEFAGERGRCAKCKCDAEMNDLTKLGHLGDLCGRCFRESIADLDLKEQEKQENSGNWEE